MRKRRSWSRPILVFVLVVVCGAALYRIGWQLWATYQRQVADRSLAERDFAAADAAIQGSLRIWPQNKDLQLLAAQTARRRKDRSRAEAHLKYCSSFDDLRGDVALEQALLELQSGKLAAEEEFLNGISREPQSFEAALVLEALIEGHLATLNAPRAVELIELFGRHHSSEADQVQVHLWRARAHRIADDPAQARKEVEEALARAPASRPARVAMVELLVRDSPDAALPHLTWLTERFPNDVEVLVLSAQMYRGLGQFDAASETLDRVFAADPARVPALVERAHVEMDRNRLEAADAWFQKAERLAPRRFEVLQAGQRLMHLHNRPLEEQEYANRRKELTGRLFAEDRQNSSSPP